MSLRKETVSKAIGLKTKSMGLAIALVAIFVISLGKAESAPRASAPPPTTYVVSKDRTGSTLKVEIKSPGSGRWEIRGYGGISCQSGSLNAGTTLIQNTKAASSQDLELVVFDSSGTTILQETLPGLPIVSPLGKKAGAARIYQLEVRTYLAKGRGRLNQGTLDDLTDRRIQGLRELGIDYIWLTGVIEHADLQNTDPDVVKGEAGSYYALTDPWDVANGLGGLDSLERAIDRVHRQGLRVVLDFVPNHTARSPKTDVLGKCGLDFGKNDRFDVGFARENNYYYLSGETFKPPQVGRGNGADGVFDSDVFSPGTQLEKPARVTGNDIFNASPQVTDWYETAKLNYGWDKERGRAVYSPTPPTWLQMVDVARYWLSKGVDGFRVDFAHSVPIEFWRFFAGNLRADYPEVFLFAEAYESDLNMKLPGFSYEALLDAGFDSVYESSSYWQMMSVANGFGTMKGTGLPGSSRGLAPSMVSKGAMPSRYMENHDEIRLASRFFAPRLSDSTERARLGWAMTAYLGLLPGHLLLHGGQELGEDASVVGSFAGDNGRTSIFDYVFQDKVRAWAEGRPTLGQPQLYDRYVRLMSLKGSSPFNQVHNLDRPTFGDLMPINSGKGESRWVSSYIRFAGNERFVVVTNTDPYADHEATLHFTARSGEDSQRLLQALGIKQTETRYQFVDVLFESGWKSRDPAVQGEGTPGWVLYQSEGIPSGLYLGSVPRGSTRVLKVEELVQ